MNVKNLGLKFFGLCALISLSACVEPVTQKINTISGDRDNLQVIPPQNCPDWTKMDGNGGSNFGNTPGSNYGCATVTNFGAMVADPNDMIVGKSSHLTNSAKPAAAISTYESGTGGGAAAAAPAASGGTP